MNTLKITTKTQLTYEQMLAIVIENVKVGNTIYKTLKKYGWNPPTFYKKSNNETIRYLNEIKCLKRSIQGPHGIKISKISKMDTAGIKISKMDTADFNVC